MRNHKNTELGRDVSIDLNLDFKKLKLWDHNSLLFLRCRANFKDWPFLDLHYTIEKNMLLNVISSDLALLLSLLQIYTLFGSLIWPSPFIFLFKNSSLKLFLIWWYWNWFLQSIWETGLFNEWYNFNKMESTKSGLSSSSLKNHAMCLIWKTRQ